MRKLVLASVLAAIAFPAVAQSPSPQTPQDCKAHERFDDVKKACVPRS